MRLRSSLFMLVLWTALPFAAFAAIVSALLVVHDQRNFVAAVQDRNRAFMSAVDAELSGHIGRLRALGALHSIEDGDIKRVHADLVAMLATQPDWLTIILLAPDGRQLVNASAPYGALLPEANEHESLERVLRTMQPTVGGISKGRFVDRYGIPVRIPIVSDGNVRYVLTAVIKQEAFADLLQRQRIPDGWVAGIVDGDGRLVARVPPRPAASLPAQAFLDAVARAPEGWNRMTTLEGIDTFTAHKTSDVTHWTVSLAIPAPVVVGATYRAAWALGAGALATVALGVVVAVALGRRIARPIDALAAAAPHLGTPSEPATPDTAIDEINALAAAFGEASSAIRAREDALQAADRAKDEFLAMLSHELRNPLAALTTAATIFRRVAPGSDDAVAAQAIVERQTKHMARLVDDLLDVSRIVTGKARLDIAPLDVADVAKVVVQTWRDAGRLSAHDVALRAEPVTIRGDRARIEQIVSNLLDNAVKFTPAGKRISIDVRREGAFAEIVVRDEGVGIAASDVGRVFDLFVQGPQDLSRQRGGMGIGLALVKRLVEMHGGHASVASDGPGYGATFTVRFPMTLPDSAQRPTMLMPRPPSAGEPDDLQRPAA